MSSQPVERKPVGMWGRAVRRLTSSTAEFENEALASQARSAGCRALEDCAPRDRVTLQGRINVVTLAPRESRTWLEADVQDGTGTLTLVWMGRRSIPGIEAGRMIRVSGRLTRRGRAAVMFNPHYELLS